MFNEFETGSLPAKSGQYSPLAKAVLTKLTKDDPKISISNNLMKHALSAEKDLSVRETLFFGNENIKKTIPSDATVHVHQRLSSLDSFLDSETLIRPVPRRPTPPPSRIAAFWPTPAEVEAAIQRGKQKAKEDNQEIPTQETSEKRIQRLHFEFLNRSLSKIAFVKKVGEGSERRSGVDKAVHEDSSTEPTNKFSTEIALGKKLNERRENDPYSTPYYVMK